MYELKMCVKSIRLNRAKQTYQKQYYLVMSSAASRILKQVKPHLPMIKFRKGNLVTQATPVLPETVVAPVVATPKHLLHLEKNDNLIKSKI